MLIEQKRVAKIRKARHTDSRRRKDVRLLSDEILRAVELADRKARHVRTLRRKWIGRRTAAVHVTEIQSVGGSEVVVDAHAELIVVVDQALRSGESVLSHVRQRK